MSTCVAGRKTPIDAGKVFELDPYRIKPFADQPRKRFRGISQLAESIRLAGQVTPIVVAACDDPDYDAQLVDGERRLRACREGHMNVKAVFESGADADRYIRSVAANFCRQSHDAVEIMEAVLTLKKSGYSNETIAGIFGKTAAWVSQYASLRKLSPAVLEELKVPDDRHKQSKAQRRSRGRVTLSMALLLVSLPIRMQLTMLRKIQAGKMSMAQARTFVHREAVGVGLHVGTRQSDYSKFKVVRSAVENCLHVVDRYLGMPGVEIAKLIGNANLSEKKHVVELLEKLCESLLMLSDALARGA